MCSVLKAKEMGLRAIFRTYAELGGTDQTGFVSKETLELPEWLVRVLQSPAGG